MCDKFNACELNPLRYDRIEMRIGDRNINKFCIIKNSLSSAEILWRLPQIFTWNFEFFFLSFVCCQCTQNWSDFHNSWLAFEFQLVWAQNQQGKKFTIKSISFSVLHSQWKLHFFFCCFAIHELEFASKGFNYIFLHICNRKAFLLPLLFLMDSMHHIHTFNVHSTNALNDLIDLLHAL